jgi:hypothetical protein
MAIYRRCKLQNYKVQRTFAFHPGFGMSQVQRCPSSNENENNGPYFCVDSSHTLSEKDKLKCPCGSLTGENFPKEHIFFEKSTAQAWTVARLQLI